MFVVLSFLDETRVASELLRGFRLETLEDDGLLGFVNERVTLLFGSSNGSCLIFVNFLLVDDFAPDDDVLPPFRLTPDRAGELFPERKDAGEKL